MRTDRVDAGVTPGVSGRLWDVVYRWQAFLVVVALIGYPCVALIPTVLGGDTRVTTLPYRGVIMALSVIVLVADAVARTPRLRVGIPLLAFGVCWAVMGIRYVHDVILEGRAPSAYFGRTEFAVFALGVGLVPTVPLFMRGTAPWLRRIERTVMALAAFVICIYLLRFHEEALAGDLARYQNEALNAITFGSMGAMLILLVYGYRFLAPGGGTTLLLRVGATILGGVALVSAASRGPLVALAVAAVPVLVVTWQKRELPRWALIGAAVVLAGMLIAFLPALVMRSADLVLTSRLSDVRGDVSTLERVYLLRASWSIFAQSPYVGGAIVEPVTLGYPHNIVLEGLMVGGIGMGILVASVVWYCLRTGWVFIAAGDDRRALGMLVIFFTVMALISGSLYTGPEFWAVFALAAAYRSGFTDTAPHAPPPASE